MDRLGSSLDRALLLAELLRTAGHQVRLARADLSEDQTKELLPKLRPVPKDPLSAPPLVSKNEVDKVINKYVNDFQLDATALRKNTEKASLRAAKLAEELTKRVAEQAPAIAKAVGLPSKKDADASRVREATDQLQALRDHWWVQRLDNKTWLDLDPLLADAQPGKQLIAAKEIITPDNKDGRIHLDGKYCHEIVIRIVIEQWKKEGLKEKTVLNQTLRPSDLFGARIALIHCPMKWPKELDLLHEKKQLEKLKSTVLAQDEWLPILTVGTDRFIQSSFTDRGDAIDTPLAPLLGGGAQKLGEDIGGILGRGKIGQPSGRNPNKNTQLTAEWIDYEIRSPGQPVRNIRREIFDLLGPATRIEKTPGRNSDVTQEERLIRGLALLGETEILPLACQPSPEFVQSLATSSLVAARNILPELALNRAMNREKLIRSLNASRPLPGQLYNLALLRHEWGRFRNDIYLDHVNILSYHKYLAPSANGHISFYTSFDIVENGIAVRSKTRTDPFVVRLEQGVLDTNTEAVLMSNCGNVQNTAEIYGATDGIDSWSTIRDVSDQNRQAFELSKDFRARLGQELAQEKWVIVPRKAPLLNGRATMGWWRVDPKTGQTLGMGERGWGQSTTEYLLTIAGITVALFLPCQIINNDFTHPGGPELAGPDEYDKQMTKCFVVAFIAALMLVDAPITGAMALGSFLTSLLTGAGFF